MSKSSDTSLRLDVSLTSSSPELVEHLLGFSPRMRSERLKFLAQLGLVVMRGGMQMAAAPTVPSAVIAQQAHSGSEPAGQGTPETEGNRARPVSSARRKAMSQLGNSLGGSD